MIGITKDIQSIVRQTNLVFKMCIYIYMYDSYILYLCTDINVRYDRL